MKIARLDHVNLRTTQLSVMIAWYRDVLGLELGARPNFPFGGAWLYAGDIAIVHIIEVDDDKAIGSEASLKLEHFALRASGQEIDFVSKLDSLGVKYRKAGLPGFGVMQYNIWDPDGNHIHVDFVGNDEKA